MRDALTPLIGERIRVIGPVVRFGSRIGWTGLKEPTLLIGPIHDAGGRFLTDHLWLRKGRRLAALNPQPGDTLALTGRVAPYYRGRTEANKATAQPELGIVYPTHCEIVAKPWSYKPGKHVHSLFHPTGPSARTQVLFALAVLSLEEPEPPTLTKLLGRARVSPISLLDVVKRCAKTGEIVFTPNGRVMLAGAAPHHYAVT